MFKVVIPGKEMFDSKTNRFYYTESMSFEIEHSLFAIKKWESKWHIHFIGNDKKTPEQMLDYVKCMTLTPNIPDDTYNKLTQQNIKDINEYMDDPMTATTFREKKSKKKERPSSNFISNEIVYWWMTELNIPQEYQYWHINQLMTLIKLINIKHEEAEEKSKKKGKKGQSSTLNKADLDARSKLNEERKRKFNSHG